jgi:uncharacterized protein (TIGR02996 family)
VVGQNAFLEAIRDDPDEDLHRLVYADWLDDQGDCDRAEFIRVQCALATLAEDDPTQAELEERERALLLAHEEEWLGSPPAGVLQWTFRCGFVDQVVLGGSGSIAGASELAARHPVRALVLEDDQDFGAVMDSPLLAGASALTVRPPLQRSVLSRFLRSPQRGRLRQLRLAGPLLDNSFAQALAASADMPNVRALYLSATPLREAGLSALVRGRNLRQLTALGLEGARISATGLATLTSSEHAPRSTELEWIFPRSRGYGPASVAQLAACINLRRLRLRLPERPLAAFPPLPRLTELVIDTHADEHLLRLLMDSGNLPRLRRLVLRGLRLNTTECWQSLSGVLEQLQRPALHLTNLWWDAEELGVLVKRVGGVERIASLELPGSALNAGRHRALTACDHFTGLRELILGARLLSDDALASLLAWPCMKRVRRLDLVTVDLLSTAARRALADSPHLGCLRELTLASGGWNSGVLAALAEWPGLARLERLQVGSPFLAEAVRVLAESPHLSPLTWVNLQGIDEQAAEALRARLGRHFRG